MERTQLDRYGNTIRETPVTYGLGFAMARYSVTPASEDRKYPTVHLHAIKLPSGQDVLKGTSPQTLERTRIECLKAETVRAAGRAA